MTDPLSPEMFRNFTYFMVLGLAVYWFCLDVYRLLRELRGDRDHDRLFGSWMGIVLALAGAGGAVKNIFL